MPVIPPSAAQLIAHAALEFETKRTGHRPESVSVVMSDSTLTITLHGALSPAERALAATPDGAAQVQEFHRRLFQHSSEPLCAEIERITGVAVREAAAEVEPSTGTIVHAFTNGAVVQVFLLAARVPGGSWSGDATPEVSQNFRL